MCGTRSYPLHVTAMRSLDTPNIRVAYQVMKKMMICPNLMDVGFNLIRIGLSIVNQPGDILFSLVPQGSLYVC